MKVVLLSYLSLKLT